MGKTLYLECNSGISGDMTVASLLDLGADEAVLEKALSSLPVQGFQTKISRVKKAGLDVCDFNVILDEMHENHDHDMEYLHGHSHEKEDGHSHTHPHVHRGFAEVVQIIEGAEATDRAKAIANRIFEILAEAEAKAHGLPKEQVHFHEVGAVDSIVDIVAASVCLDNLDIEECIIPVLCEGQGSIRCQHGLLPVPVPAVVNIAAGHQLKIQITECKGELVTPTGAAIAAAIKTKDALPADFVIEKIGMGGGKREYERPGILRAMLIEDKAQETETDVIYKLESNIDDCSGEALGYVMERLLTEGAKDVNYIPVYMKKNRPAYQLNVICKRKDISRLEQIIFSETTTLGIRRQRMERTVLERRTEKIQTSLGEATVKICKVDNDVRKYPEYESVKALCKAHKKSYQDVYQRIMRESNGNRE